MISAGEGLAIAARGPHGSCVLGGVITISGCATSNRSPLRIQAAADDAQLRPCSPGTACPGTAGSLPRSGWRLCPDML